MLCILVNMTTSSIIMMSIVGSSLDFFFSLSYSDYDFPCIMHGYANQITCIPLLLLLLLLFFNCCVLLAAIAFFQRVLYMCTYLLLSRNLIYTCMS